MISITEIGKLDSEDINKHFASMEKELSLNISQLMNTQKNHKTRLALLSSDVKANHLDWAIRDQHTLKKQSEWVNYYLANLMVCQRTIKILTKYIKGYCKAIKSMDDPEIKTNMGYVQRRLNLLYEACQSLGISIFDYMSIIEHLRGTIARSKSNFISPSIPDLQAKVSERTSQINTEIEKFLLSNPEPNILGFSSLRIFFESFLLIMAMDKLRSNIRIKEKNNKLDVRFSRDLRREDLFHILETLFPEYKNNRKLHVFNAIYDKASGSIHRGTSNPAYIIWTYWEFIASELKSKFENLDPLSVGLSQLLSEFEANNKLYIIK